MKAQPSLLLSTAVLGLLLAASPRALATDGKWTVNAGGNWSDGSRWTNSQVPFGTGAIANIEYNINANRTVTVDQPVTVGKIRFNDTGSSYYSWTLNSSGGNVFTLETSAGTPIIDVNRQTATISAPLGGTQGFLKIGGGTLTLTSSGNSNAFTGNLVVTNGLLRITSDACLGTYPASYVPDLVTLDGGNFMNNSSEVTLGQNIGITIGPNGGGIQAGWGRFITINGIISGTGPLTFRCDATPGVISLNANSTYTGTTTIGNTAAASSWSVVAVNGSLAAASAVQVNTNGFLGGTGTVNGTVGVGEQGMLGGGGFWSPGTLNINNDLSMTNAYLKADLASTTTVGGGVNDLIQVNGNVTLTGTITVSVNPLAGTLANAPYTLLSCTGTLDASGATLVCDNPRLGAVFDTATPGQIKVTFAHGAPTQLVWSGLTDNYWDIGGTSNFLNGTEAAVFYQGDGVKFDDSGAYGLPVTMVATGPGAGTIQPSSITVDTENDFTLTSTGYGRLGGSMGLFKGGSGTLTMQLASYNNANSFAGPIIITNGAIKIGDARVLGDTNAPTIVTNLGRLDTGGSGNIYEPVILAGSGPDGFGVVINSGSQTLNNGLRGPVDLVGDITLGTSNRFDFTGADFHGNGHKLTKKGPAEIALENLGETALGDIDIEEGLLTFLGDTTAANAGTRIAVFPGATFGLWNLTNDASTPLVRDLFLTNSDFHSNSGTNYYGGTLSLTGTNGILSTAQLSLLGPAVGPGALRKLGGGMLMLEGTNTYSGVTLIDAGTLALGTNASLANTPLISLSATGTNDVTALTGGLTLLPGQTLGGSGTVIGDLNAGTGTKLIPGNSAGTLTINGALNLTGTLLPFELSPTTFSGNDQIWVNGGIISSGTNVIKIVPLGALDTANPYTLMVNSGFPMASGSETNFVVATDSRYDFNLLPTDASFGSSLQVQVSGSASPALLTWQGADSVDPTLWDLKTTSNWLNGVATDKFYSGDTAVFDETAVSTVANLVGTIQPGALLLSNVSKTITLGGPGALVTPVLEVDGSGTTILANNSANQVLNGLTLNAGTLQVANAAANDFGPTINLNAGTLIFDQTVDTALGSALAGYGTLRKENQNTLTLVADSFGFNPITVNNGILQVGSAYALGDPGTTLTINPGGTLDVLNHNLTNKVVRVGGSGYNGMGAIVNSGGNPGSGAAWCLQNVTLTGDTVIGGPGVWDLRGLAVASPGYLSTEGNAYNLTKIGPQRNSIVNMNVDAALANIEIKEGIFSYEEYTTGLGNPASTLTVRSNAFLTFYRAAVPLNKVVLMDDGANIRSGSGTSNVLAGPLTISGGTIHTIAGNNTTLDLDGPISGPGGILSGREAGTVSLCASNSFLGDVTVILGNLVLSNSFAAGTNKTVYVHYTNTVSAGTGPRLFLRGGITTPPDVTGYYTAASYPGDYRCSLASDSLTNVWTGPTVLEGDGLIQFYRTGAGAELDLTGPIYGTNGFAGRAFFRGTAGYGGQVSGKIDLPAGTVVITDNTAWLFSNPGNVVFTNLVAYGRYIIGADNVASCPVLELGQPGSISSSGGTLDLNGFNQTLGFISTVNGANHFLTNGSATADSVFTYAGGTDPSTLNGRLVDGLRKLSLTVSSGTLTLAGANTYKGNTLISGGRLALGPAATLATTPVITLDSGATLDTSAMAAGLTLASGQTLTGTGTVEGSLAVGAGATLTPAGSSIGAITVTNAVIFSANGTNVAEISSGATPSSDVVNAAAVTYGGTLVMNNLGPALTTSDSFKLFNAASYSGAFAQIVPAPGVNLRWDTSSLAVDGTLRIATVSATPTPITMVLKPGGMDLSWPADHTGWRLETQLNPITIGLSTNWTTVAGSSDTNSVSITFDTNPNAAFYRLVYP